MARRPKVLDETPEEAEFFAKDKAASATVAEEADTEEPKVPEAPEEQTETESTTEDESTTESEQPPTEGEETEEGAPKGRQVPIGELYAEREKRKQLQAKIDQLEGTFQKVMARLNQGPTTPEAPKAAPEPDLPAYEADPVGHLKARLDQLQGATTQHQQVLVQQQAADQFARALAGMEAQVRTTIPDYDAAVDFAKNARLSELAALGYDETQRLEILRQEILGTAAFSFNNGRNPAEVFYQYAKARGWQGATPSKPKPAPVQPAAKLATVHKAQQAAKGLPRGGSAPPSELTLADLAEGDDDFFDANFEKFFKGT